MTVIRSLLTQPTTRFDGRYFRLRDAWCEPKATQQPHPPIVLGGKGERRLLPLVARYADHWNYSGDDVAEFARLRGRLAELCAAEGRAHRRAHAVGQRAARRPTIRRGSPTQVAAYRDAGAEMICVLLPRPYDPRLLEQLAPVLDPADARHAGDDVGHLAHEASAAGRCR